MSNGRCDRPMIFDIYFRRALIFLAIAMLSALGVAQGALAQQAQPVPIQVSTQANGAEMVFIWPDRVDYEARINGRTLEIRFGRALMPRFSEILSKLSNIVETAGVTDGGRVVKFELAADYELAHRREGNGVVIGLTVPDRVPTGTATAAAVPLAPDDFAALPAPLLAVRFGAHDAFGRAVFDWGKEVAYRVERDGNRVVVRFDSAARIAPVASDDLPPTITAMTPVASDGGLAIALDIVPDARLRDYRLGLKIVLDVMAPDIVTPEPVEEVADIDPVDDTEAVEAVEAANPTEAVETGNAAEVEEDVASVVSPTDVPTTPAATPATSVSPENQAASSVRSGWAAAAAKDATDEPTLIAEVDDAPDTQPTTAPSEPGSEAEPTSVVETPTQELPAVPKVDEEMAAVDEEPVPEVASEEPVSEVASDESAETPEMVETVMADQGPTVLVGFDKEAHGLDLEFPWSGEVGAAIFRRAGHLWVLFDSPATFSFRLLSEKMPVIEDAEQIPVPGHALARFRLSGEYKPRVKVEDGTWIVSLGASGGPSDPVDVTSQYSADVGAHLMVPDEGAGAEVVIADPEVGDQLFVVPLATVGRGVAPPRRMIDLEMLETAQGIVVRPIADTVAVRSLRAGVEITNLAGLNIGTVNDPNASEDGSGFLTPPSALTAPALPLNTGSGSQIADEEFLTDDERLFEFAAWNGDPDDGFLARKHAFNLALGASLGDERGDARLALARFHFANGQVPEMLGWIERALLDEPWLDQNIAVRALRGAGNFLLGRSDEARADLFDSELDFHREMRLWRGAYHADNGDMGAAHRAFTVAGDVPDDYPRNLSRRLRLMAAEAAAHVGEVGRAQNVLATLKGDDLRRVEQDRLDYVRGLAYEAAGKGTTALDMFERAEASDDRYLRAMAGRDRLELLLAQDAISRAEVIEGFDRLRFIWRGDQFELDLMQRMAEMYIEDGDFGNGLANYRKLISVFPNSPDARVIANVMNDTYKDLFLGDKADDLTPVEALALYYDFRELTPVGSVGDQMIFRLADRLIEVDLLPEAAAVLQHQVDYRLRGNELAKVGARLAEVYLLDKLPKQAVHALRASAVPNIPSDIAEVRRLLMIRALTETEEYRQALDLMRGDVSAKADRLRTLIYWRQKDWLSAATVTARLLENWQPGEVLTKDEGEDLMRMAVALALTNNRAALAGLREDFGALIAASEQARAFDAIASYIDAGPIDANSLSAATDEIDSYEAFLGALREKVENDKLAAVE